MSEYIHHPSSFRDPSGFVLRVKDIYYRQVNRSYAEDYELLHGSGLYRALTENKLLLPHRELSENFTGSPDWYKTLHPEQLDLISYPYEWSFDQVRDAALHTLTVQGLAIEHGMILKDANPYNIQFRDGSPVFIDSLSFEKYDSSMPWVAYRQFCECFLFPLYLEHYTGIGVQKILTAHPDGIPAAVTARLLPLKSRFNLGVWMHVYLQNIVREDGNAGKETNGGRMETGRPETGQIGKGSFSRQKLRHLIQNLESILNRLRTKSSADSTWSDYYGTTILSRNYLDEKEKIFRQFIDGIPYKSALDIGANDGHFSHILAGKNNSTILAIDADAQCINTLYRTIRQKNVGNILPLCIDIANPTPAIGFRNTERFSFTERVQMELVVALALIHHLVFGRNIPLTDIPGYLAALTTRHLIIEFVPLEDDKVQELIKGRKALHLPYNESFFEAQLIRHFTIEKKQTIPGTGRILYLMKKINRL